MSDVRIVLIHATRVAIEPIEQAMQVHWPQAEVLSILEEGLSIDRAKGSIPLSALDDRIVELANYAKRLKPAGILYTCSSFGTGIERAARNQEIPVLKPNEAMFEEAFKHGTRIKMIYTFLPAVAGMEQEFQEAAQCLNSPAEIQSVYAQGALDALKSGNVQLHNDIIAKCAAAIEDADVILLAHFSMARAAQTARGATSLPVLTSPEAAITKMKRCIAIASTRLNVTDETN